MCGIIGAIVKDSLWKVDVKNYITQGLMASSVRGEDGTGVFVVTDKGEVHLYKKPYPSWDYLQLPKYGQLLEQDIRFIVGHTRASTRGVNGEHHTHPFQFDHITLVHNGTLTSYHDLCSTITGHDSMAIAIGMAEHGELETLEKLEGAFTLVWYNAKTQRLNIAKNEERPLSLGAVAKNGDSTNKKKKKQKESMDILFASESSMLEWLAERNKIHLSYVGNYSEYTLISYPLAKDAPIETTKFKKKPITPHPIANTWVSYYKPIKEGEEFVAKYVGDYTSWSGGNDRINHKFQVDGDTQYGWIVDNILKDKNIELITNKYYKLAALEARNDSKDMQNKEAMIVEAMPDTNILILPDKGKPFNKLLIEDDPSTYYRVGSEITFDITEIKQNNLMNQHIVGTTDDTNNVGVKCYVSTVVGYTIGDTYKGIIQSIVKRGDSPGFLLVNSNSLKFKAEQVCGGCDVRLSKVEEEYNRVDNRSYCDLCYKGMSFLDA